MKTRTPLSLAVEAPRPELLSGGIDIAGCDPKSQATLDAFGGLLLGLFGLAILVALATYDPRDPSLNTATTRHVSNLAGPGGAILADMLLQGFGVVAVLPGIAMLTWSWRIASKCAWSDQISPSSGPCSR